MMKNKRRGLAIIYDPNSLRQFIWYKFNVENDTEWDALCFPYGANNIRMEIYCKKADIFKKIYVGEEDYFNMSLVPKMKLFLLLLFFYLIGSQNRIIKRVLNEYVGDVERYDVYVANSDTGLISGMVANFGDCKDVIYLEDGAFDYKERHKWTCTYKTFSFGYWQGLFMSKMGYCAKGRFYFKPTKHTIKYCTSEKNMRYRNYKSILEFRKFTDDAEDRNYTSILEKLYPELKEYDFKDVDMILFTFPLDDLTSKPEKYNKKIEDYISVNNKKIMLKKHPRDTHKYNFSDCECIEIDKRVPGEVILPFIKGKRTAFTIPCSIMLSMSDYEYDMEIIYFDDLANGIDSSVIRKYSNIEELKCELNDVNCESVRIIHI